MANKTSLAGGQGALPENEFDKDTGEPYGADQKSDLEDFISNKGVQAAGAGAVGGAAGATIAGKGKRLKGAAIGASTGMGLAALALVAEKMLTNKES